MSWNSAEGRSWAKLLGMLRLHQGTEQRCRANFVESAELLSLRFNSWILCIAVYPWHSQELSWWGMTNTGVPHIQYGVTDTLPCASKRVDE